MSYKHSMMNKSEKKIIKLCKMLKKKKLKY